MENILQTTVNRWNYFKKREKRRGNCAAQKEQLEFEFYPHGVQSLQNHDILDSSRNSKRRYGIEWLTSNSYSLFQPCLPGIARY